MKAYVVVALLCVAVVAASHDEGYGFHVKHDHHGGFGGNGFGGEGFGASGFGGGQGGSYEGGDQDGGHHFPSYKYAYGVKDHHTGDIKDAWEHRHGDHVEGEYSFKEADGTQRIVKYHANGKEGFNAIVKNIGKASEGSSSGNGGFGGEGGYAGGYGKGHSYQQVKYL